MAQESSQTSPVPTIRIRRSAERGHADHGWLNSYHTFSFANYYDPRYEGFGSLRVINEDRVAGRQGFDTHPHANYEIFSYVLKGALKHKDSMGNLEIIERGGVQFTSAGTGIYHSEFNADSKKEVHFLQMWVKPHTRNLKPNYQTRIWKDEEKLNQLRMILSPDGTDNTIKINQDTRVFASILETDVTVKYELAPGRMGYVHLAQTDSQSSLKINDVTLASGDGAFIRGPGELQFTGAAAPRAEFVFFDLASDS